MIYKQITNSKKNRKIAVLIDPDKHSENSVVKTITICKECAIDFIMVGGSLVSQPIDDFIFSIKKVCDIPIILFPGSLLQISPNADAILLLSLISGRNAEFLIGNHVIAAPILKRSNLEVISTGYMLIENGRTTSVEYMSNTRPIPAEKTDIAVATAIAGEMLGLKSIYLEAGSGALQHVPSEMILAIKQNTSIPLIVGGGIRSREHLNAIFNAGADLAVIGNSLENIPERLKEMLG